MIATVYHREPYRCYGLGPRDGALVPVARVDVGDATGKAAAEIGFDLTNHVDRYWWENPDVTCVRRARSTSVGDVVEVDGVYWGCAFVGWQEVPVAKAKADIGRRQKTPAQ